MKNDNFNGDSQFEKLLKDKMKELSSKVDVFDKISERAFPENDSDFSDSEFTVSDLENVTGKPWTLPFLKWVALAAVLVICVAMIPFSSFTQEFFSDMSRQCDHQYNELVTEFISETASSKYLIKDVTLKDYAEKDVLITPLYRCPFSYSAGEDIRVRIFTKTINDRLTNQIYAVEYTGDFKASNFIAVAESKAKFKDGEVQEHEVPSSDYSSNAISGAVNNSFICDKYCVVCDSTEETAMVASFTENKWFKLDSEILDLSVNTLYARQTKDQGGKYTYDVLTLNISENGAKAYNIPAGTELWARSLSFDGSSALPEKRASLFEKENYFSYWSSDSDQTKKENFFSYFMPFKNNIGKIADKGIVSIDLSSDQYLDADKEIGKIDVPASDEGKASMKVYIGNFFMLSSYSDSTINVRISDINENIIMRSNDVKMIIKADEDEDEVKEELQTEEETRISD